MDRKNVPGPQDDGLSRDEVGSWAEDKHGYVARYDELFSTGMKKKWPRRVYIDLFSGSGLARVRDTGKFIWGSPIRALSVKDPFDKYVFCENNRNSIEALQRRINKLFPHLDVSFVHGDCNDCVHEISVHMRQAEGALSLCFADPYDLSIRFSTVSRLAEHRLDFLVVLALHMDANRNLRHYLDPANRKIDEFLGVANWREKWQERCSVVPFPQFLAEEYAKQMETLRYLPVPFYNMKQIRSDIKNLPLYHLALFSRHELAGRFWAEVLKYGTPQRSLWDLWD